MESTKIKVTTIDYYHRDKDMKVTCGLLPKKLNSNRKYFDDSSLVVPHIKLDINVPDSGAGEQQMESLLEYIRQKGWPNGQKPDFVTNKKLLKCIASDEYDLITVDVFRFDGVVFMHKSSPDHVGGLRSWNCGAVFEHFMTKESEDEEIIKNGSVEKAVFMAEIPNSKGSFKVMYSGEIDAIDDSQQHYELKVIANGTSHYFWKNRSCSCYWQCILSNVPKMIVGSRTGKLYADRKTLPPSSIPPFSLYTVTQINVKSMPVAAKKDYYRRNRGKFVLEDIYWNVHSCETRLKKFLTLASSIENGCSYKFSKKKDDREWIVEKKEEGRCSFKKVVLSCVPQSSRTEKGSSKMSTETENVPQPLQMSSKYPDQPKPGKRHPQHHEVLSSVTEESSSKDPMESENLPPVRHVQMSTKPKWSKLQNKQLSHLGLTTPSSVAEKFKSRSETGIVPLQKSSNYPNQPKKDRMDPYGSSGLSPVVKDSSSKDPTDTENVTKSSFTSAVTQQVQMSTRQPRWKRSKPGNRHPQNVRISPVTEESKCRSETGIVQKSSNYPNQLKKDRMNPYGSFEPSPVTQESKDPNETENFPPTRLISSAATQIVQMSAKRSRSEKSTSGNRHTQKVGSSLVAEKSKSRSETGIVPLQKFSDYPNQPKKDRMNPYGSFEPSPVTQESKDPSETENFPPIGLTSSPATQIVQMSAKRSRSERSTSGNRHTQKVGSSLVAEESKSRSETGIVPLQKSSNYPNQPKKDRMDPYGSSEPSPVTQESEDPSETENFPPKSSSPATQIVQMSAKMLPSKQLKPGEGHPQHFGVLSSVIEESKAQAETDTESLQVSKERSISNQSSPSVLTNSSNITFPDSTPNSLPVKFDQSPVIQNVPIYPLHMYSKLKARQLLQSVLAESATVSPRRETFKTSIFL